MYTVQRPGRFDASSQGPSPVWGEALRWTVLLAVIGASGCAPPRAPDSDGPWLVEVPVVGWFHDYDEMLRGRAMGVRYSDHSVFVLEGARTGMRCVGRTELVELPIVSDPLRQCDGRVSRGSFRCSDGRRAEVSFRANGCAKGIAQGVDATGNRMTFFVGYPESELEELAQMALSRAESRPELPRFAPEALREAEGFSTGTGFFVSDDGHLLTNYHVVEGAHQIEVVLPGGQAMPATYLERDTTADLALLQVEGLRSTPLPIARSAEIAKGQEVFTVGFPLVDIQGQAAKATFGRINALSGLRDDADFVQIDVPIQPGNSGGPLLNRQGRVVGVVTATLDQAVAMRLTGTFAQNVNYALKPDILRRFLREGRTRLSPPNEERPPPERDLQVQVERAERSIVLVVCR